MTSYGYQLANVAWRRILNHVFPDPCLACGLAPAAASQPRLGLCVECRGRLVATPETSCLGCGRVFAGVVDAAMRCGRCRRQPPGWEALVWAWRYGSPVDAVIAGLKFGRLDYLGPRLGRAAADVAGRRLRGPEVRVASCDAVTSVPLHWRRRWVRGYDQATLIAAGVASELGLPFRATLRRRRSTPPQSLADTARRRQRLAGAFVCSRPNEVRGRRLLLVDDVVTTGGTLRAATRALQRAGARVVVLAVARTPAPSERGPSPLRLASQGQTA